jgi:hypothetical protein
MGRAEGWSLANFFHDDEVPNSRFPAQHTADSLTRALPRDSESQVILGGDEYSLRT